MRLLKSLYDHPAFSREAVAVGAGEVIIWWESRRIFFNFAVGLTGIIACVLMIVCAFVSEPLVGEAIGLPDGPLLGLIAIFIYGILANVCYTSGWICELFSRGILAKERSSAFGLLVFRAGVTFSIALTIAPAILSWVIFGIALAHGQTHTPNPE